MSLSRETGTVPVSHKIPCYKVLKLHDRCFEFSYHHVSCQRLCSMTAGQPANCQRDMNVNQGDMKVNQRDMDVNQGDMNVNQRGMNVNQRDMNVNQRDMNVNRRDMKVNQRDMNVNHGDMNASERDMNVNQIDMDVNKHLILRVRDIAIFQDKTRFGYLNVSVGTLFKHPDLRQLCGHKPMNK